MTINKLAAVVAKLEGKKSQARIGDIREILGILSDLVYVDSLVLGEPMRLAVTLYENGKRRAKKKPKSRKVKQCKKPRKS